MDPVIMGLETEYGLLWDEAQSFTRHVSAHSLFSRLRRSVWHNPHVMGELQVAVLKSQSPNMFGVLEFLGNGSRLYLDGDHPELSVAESANPREATLYDEAGTAILADATARLNDNQPIPRLYKRSGDGWGHTWGCHENYAISPRLFSALTDTELQTGYPFLLGTFLIVRQLLTGAGKLGPDAYSPKYAFQHSQRADFIRHLQSDNTLLDRAIINRRDESLANDGNTRRLHLICGEANRCQWSTYLKLALTALLLRMLQDDSTPLSPLPAIVHKDATKDYPAAFRMVSRDLEMDARYPVCILGPGTRVNSSSPMTAVDILTRYVDAIAAYARSADWGDEHLRTSYLTATDKAVWAVQCLAVGRWRELYGVLDWPTKRLIAEEYLQRKGHTWQSAVTDADFWGRVRTLGEVSFTALSDADSIYNRLVNAGRIQQVVRPSEVIRAMAEPPPGRARQRMQIAGRYARYLFSLDWHRLVFRQPDLTTTLHLTRAFGVSQSALNHALSVCPSPHDFAGFLERNPIPGISVAVSFT